MPRDTDQMKYNYDRHLYQLDVEYLKNELGIDFLETCGSLTRAKDKSYQISRQVYDYVLSHNMFQPKYVEYNMAFDESLRPVIQEALEWQARYEYESNISKLKMQHGINLLNGQVIKMEDLYGLRTIHSQTHLLLLRAGLLYQGRYNTAISENSFNYEEMGY